MTTDGPLVESIARLELKPGDVLVARVSATASMAEIAATQRYIEGHVPSDSYVVVLPENVGLEAVAAPRVRLTDEQFQQLKNEIKADWNRRMLAEPRGFTR